MFEDEELAYFLVYNENDIYISARQALTTKLVYYSGLLDSSTGEVSESVGTTVDNLKKALDQLKEEQFYAGGVPMLYASGLYVDDMIANDLNIDLYQDENAYKERLHRSGGL